MPFVSITVMFFNVLYCTVLHCTKGYFISSAWSSSSHSIQILPYPTLPPPLLYYIFQIFSSNLSKPITRGGIKWSLCRSKSLGTSYSTQGQDDSSSSSTTGLHCTVLHSSIYRCDVRPYVAINISIRYGSEWVTFFCSYVFCHKMVTNGRILEFEVSIEPS